MTDVTQAAKRKAEPSWLTKDQVFDLAEAIAKQINFTPGDDIRDLVHRLGGRIEVEDTLTTDPEQSGSLFVDAPNKFTIIVPAHTSLFRDNYTIAHELGHYLVHYVWNNKTSKQPSNTMVALRKGSNRVEWEANWFAAAFLMPKKEFNDIWKQCNGDLNLVSKRFLVSRKAAEIRAREFGLLS